MESRRNFLKKGEILIGSFIAGSAPGSYQKHKTSNNILEFGAKGDGSDDTCMRPTKYIFFMGIVIHTTAHTNNFTSSMNTDSFRFNGPLYQLFTFTEP